MHKTTPKIVMLPPNIKHPAFFSGYSRLPDYHNTESQKTNMKQVTQVGVLLHHSRFYLYREWRSPPRIRRDGPWEGPAVTVNTQHANLFNTIRFLSWQEVGRWYAATLCARHFCQAVLLLCDIFVRDIMMATFSPRHFFGDIFN